jgi:subtilisin family serine protease
MIIFDMKRDAVVMRKAISPQLEVFGRLTSPGYGIVSEEHSNYFRDVHDHLIRVFESADSYRELMGGALDAYLSTVSNRMNEVMKRLTVMAALFLPIVERWCRVAGWRQHAGGGTLRRGCRRDIRLLGKRSLVIIALCVVANLGPSVFSGRTVAAPLDIPSDHVVVRYSSGVQAQMADGRSATWEQQGYRTLAVPADKTREQFLTELRRQPDVASAEPDGRVTAAVEPNDPLYASSQKRYLDQIAAAAAWNLTTGSRNVVVAVVDSGIDLAHPEFAGRLWENTADAYDDGIDHDSNGCVNDRYGCRFVQLSPQNHAVCGYTENSPTSGGPNRLVQDDSGALSNSAPHGTFVSGIIGAAGNNGIGVTGIAWNVRLMTVKVLDCGTGPGGAPSGLMSDVAQGILYATHMGANIINLSLSSDDASDDTQFLRNAIQTAQDAGVIVVAAAGNYGTQSNPAPGYPGAYTQYRNLVTVGAADQNNGDTRESFSAYGPSLDFAAPGGPGIASTGRSDINPYVEDHAGGTSFAAPMVSGMFALMMSRNSHLNAGDYIQLARDSATPTPPMPGGGNWAGSGIINIGAAVARVPMTVTGAALRDWKDVPAGTEVRASIDGNDCGVTNSIAIGPAAVYTVRIKSGSEQPGCGAPGKAVQLSIGGVPAQPALTWGSANVDLGLLNKDISTVSPDPGAVVVQALNGGWSNVAQFDPPGNLPAALTWLPTPWSAVYRWKPETSILAASVGAFERFIRGAPQVVNTWRSVATYDTFWVDAPATNIASLNPNPPGGRVLQLNPGWNNFVYTGSSKEVEDALSELAGKYTEVVQYDNAAKAWLIHTPNQPRRYLNDFGGVFKLKVYWVYMTDAGTLTMS